MILLFIVIPQKYLSELSNRMNSMTWCDLLVTAYEY